MSIDLPDKDHLATLNTVGQTSLDAVIAAIDSESGVPDTDD